MNIEMIAELAWKSVLCVGVALLLLRFMHKRSAAEKSLVASAALAALLMLPLGFALVPEIELVAPNLVADSIIAGNGSADTSMPSVRDAFTAENSSWSISPGAILITVYAFPALFLLVGLTLGVLRLQRIRGRSDVLQDSCWLSALARAQHRLGVKHGTALLASNELNSPVSWGVVRPIIIVDRVALDDREHAEAIIAHELAHVVRMDWLTLLLGRLAICLFWFNPLVWILARQAHQLCEEAADDAVLRAGINGVDYVDVLVGAVRHSNGGALLPANGVAPSSSSLGKRVAHILDNSRARRTPGLAWAAAVFSLAFGFYAALAAATPTVGISRSIDAAAGDRAAARLQHMTTPQARRIGLAIRHSDWNLRRTGGSSTFSEPRAIAPLLDALRDDEAVVRRLAVWGLSEIRPDVREQAAEAVAPLLNDASPAVRAQAARALAEFGYTQASTGIAALLRDPDPFVRADAAHALGDLLNPRTRGPLEAARGDPDPAVRDKVSWALRQLDEAHTALERYSGG
jgi:beta-lactamase regulating signal transducer with metallopeptidase domain